ncbi:MAG: hypothetical protein KDE03_03785, partial [Rhodobacteraceae bacterium]|nr:hypothetical protein [Paracoccaceae bacterium]
MSTETQARIIALLTARDSEAAAALRKIRSSERDVRHVLNRRFGLIMALIVALAFAAYYLDLVGGAMNPNVMIFSVAVAAAVYFLPGFGAIPVMLISFLTRLRCDFDGEAFLADAVEAAEATGKEPDDAWLTQRLMAAFDEMRERHKAIDARSWVVIGLAALGIVGAG